jgi:glycosyltransferase involved in cell wall biosynthesis
VSQQPLISVCIPCYNGAEFLGHTLESVLVQTFTDFELVVADDKSTDDTVSVIKGFTDRRIKFTENGCNLGMGLNWNQVLSRSVGKYVKLLCEDDVLHPECLARQAEILQNPANSGVVLAVCNRKVINAEDKVILSRGIPFRSGLVSGAKLIRKSVRWGSNLIGEPAVAMFRRKALEPTTSCDVSNPYLSDLSLWAQLLKHGDAFLDDQYLAAFRISPGAASSRIGRGQGAAFRRFVQTLRKDPFYEISSLDAMIGYALSFQWCLIRNLFIKLHSSHAARQRSGTSALETWPLFDRKRCSKLALESGHPAASLQSTARHRQAEEDIVMRR